MQQQLNGLRYSTSKMKFTFYKTTVSTTENSTWNIFCCAVTMCFPINKTPSTPMSWMEKIVAEQEHNCSGVTQIICWSCARGLHLASAFVWGHITEEGRSTGQVVDSGLSHALPYCGVFQGLQQWLTHCNAMAGKMRYHTQLKTLTHSQEAWGWMKDAHQNVWPLR